MVVIVLGVVASASTWAFNVVRGLLALDDPRAFSLYAETGEDFIKNLATDCGHIVVKAHRLDRTLIALANAAGFKIVLTDRDPLDSVVSQRERFGHPVLATVRNICRSYAAMAALGPGAPTLALSYETGFPSDPGAIRRLADFLGVGVTPEQAAGLFETHRAENLKPRIEAWAQAEYEGFDPAMAELSFDDATHWHPGHLGDGETGKGRERLSPEEIRIVAGACVSWRNFPEGKGRASFWPAAMFHYAEGQTAQLALASEEKTLVWGPYCALPPGRWRATPVFSRAAGEPVYIRLEAFVPNARRNALAMRVCRAGDGDEDETSISFTQLDHEDEVEIRIHSVFDSLGALAFEGVKLQFLGPLRGGPPVQARPASLGLPDVAGDAALADAGERPLDPA
jgi:hypothetical protein